MFHSRDAERLKGIYGTLTAADSWQVLRLVHSSLEDSTKVVGSSIVQSALNTLPQLIEQCGMVHEEANGLMVSLKPPTGKDSSLPFIKRVRFLFQKSRITVLRSLLDSSKSTLNLLLVTLNIEMAKSKSPDNKLMDQLQSERKAFIRVVASQSKALEEALKEVDKAKKETAKLKNKADKEKQKQKEKEKETESETPEKPDDRSTLQPPSMYMLPSPSVTQFVYTPPPIDTTPQTAVMSLALSLEPPKSTYSSEMPSPPTSPPNSSTYNSYPTPPQPPQPPQPPYPSFQDTTQPPPKTPPTRPDNAKRVFSDPGPPKRKPVPSETLHPGSPPRERSRSPYGFSRVPKDDPPNVERARSPYGPRPAKPDTASPEHHIPEKPRTASQQPSKPKIPPPPPPRHGIPYVALSTYTSQEIGHLNLIPFDILVDIISHTPEEDDAQQVQYWQASLNHRRGPRGLFPYNIVCPVDDDRVDQRIKEAWFASSTQLVADMAGRVWVGPDWQFEEPVRRRSKWWASEF